MLWTAKILYNLLVSKKCNHSSFGRCLLYFILEPGEVFHWVYLQYMCVIKCNIDFIDIDWCADGAMQIIHVYKIKWSKYKVYISWRFIAVKMVRDWLWSSISLDRAINTIVFLFLIKGPMISKLFGKLVFLDTPYSPYLTRKKCSCASKAMFFVEHVSNKSCIQSVNENQYHTCIFGRAAHDGRVKTFRCTVCDVQIKLKHACFDWLGTNHNAYSKTSIQIMLKCSPYKHDWIDIRARDISQSNERAVKKIP